MPWNGAGTYNLPPAYSPEVNGTTIDANRYNGLTGDVAAGVTASLAKNGENVATANLPMGGFKHTGAVAATASGQYLMYGQNAAALAKTGGVVGSGILQITTDVNDEVQTRITLTGIASWDQRITVTGALQTWRANGSVLVRNVSFEGYHTFYQRVGINGKTPVAAVAAPAVATDLATAITLVNDIRTRLINFGIYI